MTGLILTLSRATATATAATAAAAALPPDDDDDDDDDDASILLHNCDRNRPLGPALLAHRDICRASSGDRRP